MAERILIASFLVFLVHVARCSSPTVFWFSQPVLPNNTVLVYGAFLNDTYVQFCPQQSGTCTEVKPETTWESSSTFVVPDDVKLDIYTFQICNSAECSKSVSLNRAEVWWLNGDQGPAASIGGWIRIYGRSLSFYASNCISSASPLGSELSETEITLVDSSQQNIVLPVSLASCYDLYIEIPASVPAGFYSIRLQNSLTGSNPVTTTREGANLQIEIISSHKWPSTIFDVDSDYNGDIISALESASSNGGGIVQLGEGNYKLNESQTFSIGEGVTLQGKGSNETQIWWIAQASSETVSTPLMSTVGNFRILDIGLFVNLSSSLVLNISENSSGQLLNSAIRKLLPEGDAGNLFQVFGSNIDIVGNEFYHVGNCTGRNWPLNCGFFLSYTNYLRLTNNTFYHGCQGYAGFGINNVHMSDNAIYSFGPVVSDGNGFSTLGDEPSTQYNAILRNYQVGFVESAKRYEAWTSDGPGYQYFGQVNVSSSNANTIVATGKLTNPTSNYTGAVAVVNGTGQGQVSQVSSSEGNIFYLKEPFQVPLDETSYIAISPYRGSHIICGNEWVNGTTVQVYGAAYFTIMSDNKFSTFNTLASWGLHYGGNASVQPSFYTEMNNNQMENAGAIRTLAQGKQTDFTGPWIRAQVIRGNILNNNTGIEISGATSDVVIENNILIGIVSGNEIEVDSESSYVYQRGNALN